MKKKKKKIKVTFINSKVARSGKDDILVQT